MTSSKTYSSLKMRVEFDLIYIDNIEHMTSANLPDVKTTIKVVTSFPQAISSTRIVNQTEKCELLTFYLNNIII